VRAWHGRAGTATMNVMSHVSEPVPSLIKALCEPRAYGHPVGQVELRQTHISWVLLAGDFAYKIKKPVHWAFLDFSTLDLRRKYCEAELALNRLFAPDLYIGVVAIAPGPTGLCMDSAAPAVEYAVKMRRFDESQRLDHVCGRGELKAQHLSVLATDLQAYYAAAPVAAAHSDWGQPTLIGQQVLENFETSEPLLDKPELRIRLQQLRSWTQAQLALLEPVMRQRRQAGRIRACHGDLHLANLVWRGDRVQAFDCIEFSDALRWIDVLSDLAFVYVDLLARHQQGLANWWLSEVLQASAEEAALPLLRFYAVYRAMVRLKVACLRQGQGGDTHSEVEAYLELAERLIRPEPLDLVITHGLSGSGKTVASGAWLLQDNAGRRLRVRADVQRKRLFGLSAVANSQSDPGQGIYDAQANAKTYAQLRAVTRQLLQAGWSVVVDASFIRQADRQDFAKLAKDVGARFLIMAPQASLAVMRQRITARQAVGQDASEATLDVLARQVQVLEPLAEQERLHLLPATHDVQA
jgi:aminoglycoside phosphotransferase family enzyme/predicted kinase